MQTTTLTRSDDRAGGLDAAREGVRRMWGSVAPAWEANADYIDARGAAVTQRLLDATAPKSGERALELACGAGGLGLATAALVAPNGEVVLSDVAAEMAAIAQARADALGAGNVSTRVLDLEEIDAPASSFDLVLCREGLMFAFDHVRAAREIRRVLRPGGRFAVAVWGPRERNPWLGLVFDVVTAELGVAVPPPGIPGPFSLSSRDVLATMLSDAGLSDFEIADVPTPLRAASFDEWWARTCALAGPLANVLASLPDDASRAVRERACDAVAAYETAEGLELPGLALVAAGRRPV